MTYPHAFLCRLLGHKRRYHDVSGVVWDRRGFWRQGVITRVRCERCGSGGNACYEPGWLEAQRNRWREIVLEIESYHVPAAGLDPNELPF